MWVRKRTLFVLYSMMWVRNIPAVVAILQVQKIQMMAMPDNAGLELRGCGGMGTLCGKFKVILDLFE